MLCHGSQQERKGGLSSTFSFFFFLSVSSKKLKQLANWEDVEERVIDRIKATLPDAELAL